MYRLTHHCLLLILCITSIYAETIRLLGRVNPETRQLTWPSSGITFDFTGTRAAIKFSEFVGANSVTVTVDHENPYVIAQLTTQPLVIENLLPGTHRVVVEKRNEFIYGSMTFDNVTTDGQLIDNPLPSTPRIEYIGDSITAGWGAGGVHPCTNNAAMEDAPGTYAAITAKTLGVHYSLLAWSGKGLVRNINTPVPDDSPRMPELWTRYGVDDEDYSYTFPGADPLAVVINLGTNDYSYSQPAINSQMATDRGPLQQSDYIQAYISLVTEIRQQYSKAHIFLCASPMLIDNYFGSADTQHTDQLKALEEVASTLADFRVHVVDFPSEIITRTLNGCDLHPGPLGHQEMADILTPILQTVVSWY